MALLWRSRPSVIRAVWVVYSTPTTNIDRRDVIGKTDESARYTGEQTLVRTVGFIDVTAGGASPAGVARINRHNGDADALRLVLNLLAQVVKRPAREHSAPRLTSRDPLADMRQFFQRNPATSALCLRYDLFADDVVGMVGKTAFLPRQFLQTAACAKRPFDLQLAPESAVTETDIIDGAGAVDLPVTVNGDIDYAEINAKKALHIDQRILWNVASRVQKPLAFAVDQIGLALLIRQQRPMVSASDERNSQTPAYRPDRNALVGKSPVEDAAVVGDAAVRLERSPRRLVLFVSINHLADTAHRHLCRKFVVGANGVVRCFVQADLRELFGFPCDAAGEITRGIGALKRSQQVIALFVGWEKFHHSSQFHPYSVAQNTRMFNQVKGKQALSSTGTSPVVSPRRRS